jgi:AcrR family transcriptional regulator
MKVVGPLAPSGPSLKCFRVQVCIDLVRDIDVFLENNYVYLMSSTLLPRSRPVSVRALAAASQRDRILVAMVDAVVELGYQRATVSEVIGRAGVSRRTFYEYFADRDECFLAAYDRGLAVLGEILATREAELEADAGWRVRLEAMLGSFLRALAAEPAFAQAAFVEVLGAGPQARDRYLRVADRFHAMVRDLADEAERVEGTPHLSETAISMLTGGVNRLVMIELLAGRGSALSDHLDEIVRVATAVVCGVPE